MILLVVVAKNWRRDQAVGIPNANILYEVV